MVNKRNRKTFLTHLLSKATLATTDIQTTDIQMKQAFDTLGKQKSPPYPEDSNCVNKKIILSERYCNRTRIQTLVE